MKNKQGNAPCAEKPGRRGKSQNRTAERFRRSSFFSIALFIRDFKVKFSR
jgi:hypothetical protein